MIVAELIEVLKGFPQETKVLVSSDEELNTMFEKIQIGDLKDGRLVFYGLSGSETE